jgi:hypothetical protein
MSKQLTEALKRLPHQRDPFENPIGDYVRAYATYRWGLPSWRPPKLVRK